MNELLTLKTLSKDLTARELFAAMAMQGLMADTYIVTNMTTDDAVIIAVKAADDLINELNKPTK